MCYETSGRTNKKQKRYKNGRKIPYRKKFQKLRNFCFWYKYWVKYIRYIILNGGQDESAFTKVHDNNIVKAKKRMYMTATPRLYTENKIDLNKKKSEQILVGTLIQNIITMLLK